MLVMAGGCTNPTKITQIDFSAMSARRITSRKGDSSSGVYETAVLGPGAHYKIWVPPNWQLGHRGLVLYAHGYANPAQPLVLPDNPAVFQAGILLKGYAVAYSSYSESGWAVKDGAIRTRQLRGYFTDAYGKRSPVRSVSAAPKAGP